MKFRMSEAVARGHPDKVADQIADAILDEYLGLDANTRTAIEVMVTTNKVIVAGEVSVPNISNDSICSIVRNVVKDIGYCEEGFDWRTLNIEILLHGQSDEIANSVIQVKEECAGDQGIVIGYATNETESYMPAPVHYAHKIIKEIVDKSECFGPDGKAQVNMRYNDSDPSCIENIVVSVQHGKNMHNAEISQIVMEKLSTILPYDISEDIVIINPSGSFIDGGPASDCGLTGRKIMVDTYGGVVPHGGGAFSGKDSTKIDRSGAYLARYLAKNIVSAGIARQCMIQLCYAIGLPKPLSLGVYTYGTGIVNDNDIARIVKRLPLDLSLSSVIHYLGLRRPIYHSTAASGHFGYVDKEDHEKFLWERLDLVDALQSALVFS